MTRKIDWKKIVSIGASLVFLTSFFIAVPVARAASYEAVVVSMSGSGEIVMEPGERREFRLEFLNSGSANWQNDGHGYISLYTYAPKYRRTVFDPGTWIWGDHVKRIDQTSVAPGEKATMSFELHAPQDEGYYEETFHLASEDTAWVSGGDVTFKITVAEKGKEIIDTVSSVSSNDGYDADLTVMSANKIKTKAGTSILFTAGFTNTGSKTWTEYGLSVPDVSIASSSGFSHPSWNGSQVALASGNIRSGEMAILNFSFIAPQTNGNHTAKFQLQANGVDVPGAIISIPVEVTGGSGDVVSSPVVENYDSANIIDEPVIRVGILTIDEETDDQTVITSDSTSFKLKDINGNLLAELGKGEEVTAYFDGSRYIYDVGRGSEISSYALRFEPDEENAVMRIANFDRRLTRNAVYADNEYRGILEFRYNDYKDRAWIINELPIEFYLRGLAETSNVSPIEYQKSLITAARTFAYYHWTHATKRAKEFMTVVSYSDDQVYNGYGQEKRAPKITQAVQETYGYVVTYDGDLAITPYFSRSDGHTRDWGDVWYGNVEWCQSVDVPWDNGKTLWGHGVGMSALGALGMANDRYSWEEILKYFYTGIELEKTWIE